MIAVDLVELNKILEQGLGALQAAEGTTAVTASEAVHRCYFITLRSESSSQISISVAVAPVAMGKEHNSLSLTSQRRVSVVSQLNVLAVRRVEFRKRVGLRPRVLLIRDVLLAELVVFESDLLAILIGDVLTLEVSLNLLNSHSLTPGFHLLGSNLLGLPLAHVRLRLCLGLVGLVLLLDHLLQVLLTANRVEHTDGFVHLLSWAGSLPQAVVALHLFDSLDSLLFIELLEVVLAVVDRLLLVLIGESRVISNILGQV
mmetsp:Transcript_29971/g.45830  ORF Transcript_29971/g.45830 Transcript_29971/m.45830 type:complete len:258 (-) Transcript_29971:125-898(-)